MNKSERDMWNRLKEPAPIISEYGTQRWYNKAGELHRENDLPAVIYKDGHVSWWKNGEVHRDNDMPAVIFPSKFNRMEWWVNDKFIRSESPDD